MPDIQDITEHEITEAMIQLGGSFVSRLGTLFRYADGDNKARLIEAFPHYWITYTELALARRKEARPA